MGTSERTSDGDAETMAVTAEWTVAHSAVLNDAVIARKCEWGFSCRFGAMCLAWHSLGEHEHFAVKQQVKKREWEEKCAFCVRGCCRHGEMCRRGMDGRNVNAIETRAGLGREHGEDESDYESAEEGPPEKINDRRRGPRVEESWSEDWDEKVVAGRLPQGALHGANQQNLMTGGNNSALSGDIDGDEAEQEGDAEDVVVFNTRVQMRKPAGRRQAGLDELDRAVAAGRKARNKFMMEGDHPSARKMHKKLQEIELRKQHHLQRQHDSKQHYDEQQHIEQHLVSRATKQQHGSTNQGLPGRAELQGWAERIATAGKEHNNGGTKVMTGAKRKEEEQKAERRARKPVEEMKGEGKMQHRPG